MNTPPQNSEEFLACWRGALPGHEVSTSWSEEHGCWVCSHRLDNSIEFSEMLDVYNREHQDEALLAELRALNVCAPLIAADRSSLNGTPRVFVDGENWSSWHPCDRCGGFAWQLPLVYGIFGQSEIGSELERELARLLAHRAIFLHGVDRDEEDCVGCVEARVAKGIKHGPDHFPWFCSQSQEWHLLLRIDSENSADFSLGLPPWATGEELNQEIQKVIDLGRQGPPYDWQREGDL